MSNQGQFFSFKVLFKEHAHIRTYHHDETGQIVKKQLLKNRNCATQAFDTAGQGG